MNGDTIYNIYLPGAKADDEGLHRRARRDIEARDVRIADLIGMVARKDQLIAEAHDRIGALQREVRELERA